MKLRFTKMQGAGNDFVVLDATRGALPLDRALLQRLGDLGCFVGGGRGEAARGNAGLPGTAIDSSGCGIF